MKARGTLVVFTLFLLTPLTWAGGPADESVKIMRALELFRCEGSLANLDAERLFPRKILAAYIRDVAHKLPELDHGLAKDGPDFQASLGPFNQLVARYVETMVAVVAAHGHPGGPSASQLDSIRAAFRSDLQSLFMAQPSPTAATLDRVRHRWDTLGQKAEGSFLREAGIVPEAGAAPKVLTVEHYFDALRPRMEIKGQKAASKLDDLVQTALKGRSEFALNATLSSEDLALALPLFVKGLDHLAGDAIRRASSAHAFTPEQTLTVGKALAAVSKDPEIARLYTLLSSGLPTVEEMMFRSQGALARPQQLEGARAVLQYGHLETKSRILEIGPGDGGTLNALSSYVPKGKLIGLEIQSPLSPPLLAKGVQLIFGDAFGAASNPAPGHPNTTDVALRVAAHGPYDVVLGVDVFKSSNVMGQSFRTRDRIAYVQWIFSLMAEGGVWIILNDYEAPSYFERAELEAAGFSVVRWKVQRTLSEAERQVLPASQDPKLGVMSLYVLRKGTFDPSKLMATGRL